MKNITLTYKSSGVDVSAADQFIEDVKSRIKSTWDKNVVGHLSAFASLYDIGNGKYLAASVDGVGTKLKIAFMMDKHDTVGQDLVAMCVNDLITTGAAPLFVLDYIATGRLEQKVQERIVSGIVDGCKLANCALVGGETAEMPGFYQEGEYDLAGFAVGLVNKNEVVDGSKIRVGDRILGFPSSGLHSNGYSLVRKVLFEKNKCNLEDGFDNCTLGDELLKPTRIYVKPVLEILEACREHVRGMANVTGSGFLKLKKMNDNFGYVVDKLLPTPEIFHFVQGRGKIEDLEMFKTFNMGIGFVLISDQPEKVLEICQTNELGADVIGFVTPEKGVVEVKEKGLVYG